MFVARSTSVATKIEKISMSKEMKSIAENLRVHKRWRKICFIDFLCVFSGFCMNWQALFTLDEISSIVIVAY